METCRLKAVYKLHISVCLLQFMMIVNSLTNFMLITSMLIAKLTLFLHNADWLTYHFQKFSLFVL